MRAGFAIAFILAAAPVFAQEPKVDVNADIVQASTQPGTVEAALAPMQLELAKGDQGKKYTSMKRLSTQKLTLVKKPMVLPLPNKKNAELSLVALDKGVATVKVKVVPGTEAVLKLGKQGSLFQHAGAFENGDLWLVLSEPK